MLHVYIHTYKYTLTSLCTHTPSLFVPVCLFEFVSVHARTFSCVCLQLFSLLMCSMLVSMCLCVCTCICLSICVYAYMCVCACVYVCDTASEVCGLHLEIIVIKKKMHNIKSINVCFVGGGATFSHGTRIAKIDLESGKTVMHRSLPERYFGEGIVILGDRYLRVYKNIYICIYIYIYIYIHGHMCAYIYIFMRKI